VYPPAFEREIEELFARFAPPAASGDLGALIDSAEEHGLIEPFIPVESQKPAGRFVKQGFAKALGWYHTWLTQEISQFAGASVRALRVAADRLAAIEQRLGQADEHRELLASIPFASPDGAVGTAVVATLRGCAGRVLVARGGDGALVRELVTAGLDAYGVEPDAALRDLADELGVDLLPDDTVSHLDSVRTGGLRAAVLCGPEIDAMPVGARVALARAALARIEPGGSLVIIGSQPAGFAERQPVVADLAAAKPFGANTWRVVLERLGASSVGCETIGDGLVVVATADRKGG
jgi:hypothetical protein